MSWFQDHKKAVIVTSSIATVSVVGLSTLAYLQHQAAKEAENAGDEYVGPKAPGGIKGKIAIAVASTAILGAGGAIYKYGMKELAGRAMGMFKRSNR